MKFEVGQKLWYVHSDRYSRLGDPADRGAEVTVTTVGRKWVGIDGHLSIRGSRFNMRTMWVDRGRYSSPGRVYLSREEYRRQYAVNLEWSWLKRAIPDQPPPHITPDAIQLIASVIGLEPRKKTA
jgi:hypothetical protein